MSEPAAEHEHSTDPSPAGDSGTEQRNVRITTLILLVIIALLFAWYLVADRLTPYTASARLKVYVVQIVPDISGYIAEIPVRKNQLVPAGDPLLIIEKIRFENAVELAEADLELAGQEVGANTASVATAAANLAAQRTRLEEAQVQGARILALAKKGVISQAQADTTRATIKSAKAGVSAAESELERTRQTLGAGDKLDNPRARRALAALEEARLNLSRTTVKAPSRGYIAALKLDVGAYATAGQPTMSFISSSNIWIEAYMTENNLGNIKLGDKVELAFDAFPGEIYEGKIKSLPTGVSTGKKTDYGDLSTAEKSRSWLREPQRYPLLIETTNYEYGEVEEHGLRLNSQVDVIVYTGDNHFWNTLGGFWIRLMSLLSYAY
jgi:multidrug resistance efflux pump